MDPVDPGNRTDRAWTVRLDARLERVAEALCTLADGRFGTRGAREEDGAGSGPLTAAAGVYHDPGGGTTLLPGPVWTGLEAAPPDGHDRRELDLRGGVLRRTWRTRDGARLRSLRFVSLARPGVAGLRAEGPAGTLGAGPALLSPGGGVDFEQGRHGDFVWARTRSAGGGGITAAAGQRTSGGGREVERLAVYLADADHAPPPEAAAERLREAEAVGFDRLLAEHRAAWAARWADAEVAIPGDPDAELAVRFALFHLLASAAGEGEAAVGARGLTGPAYAGHVFWDADVFVLPVLAALHPAAARAMLEYRIRRLGPARRLAAAQGRSGARFAWESAADGSEVTPLWVTDRLGNRVRVRAGELEDHIVADVAWAACRYADWTGDAAVLDGPGRALLLDTARYWGSRVRRDEAGRAHIDGVIGPDEYHLDVDDNAFTNVMARWNLRRAADLAERAGGATAAEVRDWRRLADALVDGYDPATGRYRQFSGFDDLEPMVIGELARPPVAADLLLGRDRVQAAQVVKQADVLMLHLLVPEETAAGSLVPNLAFYGPRTAHGSSLSPAVHAALLARAGDPDRALELFRLACRLDLDDLTGTSAGGLHVATMGGVWQALTTGFCGLRPTGQALELDPCLPITWEAVELGLRYSGRRLHLRAGHDQLELATDGPVRVSLPGLPAGTVVPPGATWRRADAAWELLPRPAGGTSGPRAVGRSAGAAAARMTEAEQGGTRPPGRDEEATSMTATESTATSLEGLLGTVGEAMTGEVVALEADTPVDVALRRLEHSQVSGAPVLHHGRVVGVVTLRDLLVPVLADGPVLTTGPFHRHEHQLTAYRVHELMTAEPVTARPDWPLARAVLAMEQAGINRLPVVDAAGRPTGILTRDDVLRVLTRRVRELGRPAGHGSQIEPD